MGPMNDPAAAPLADWTAPTLLTGRAVRLEPLTGDHAAGLFRHADADTVALLSRGGAAEHSVGGWRDYITRLNALPNRVNWAVMKGAEVAGRISYSAVHHDDRWIEIGTMLTPPFQGGACNPEAKLLLMERAFSVLGAGRVQFKVDARNARSRAAMRKLGAAEEGTLRQYQRRADGSARDSVMYSVLAEEWPTVRANLIDRVSAVLAASDTA